MPKPFPVCQLEAKILRYLLEEGRPVDFTEIRFSADGLVAVDRQRIWSAIRSLIEAGWVSYAYRMEVTTYQGFKQSMSYPVFWVNRDKVVRDRVAELPGREWWRSIVSTHGGEGVDR